MKNKDERQGIMFFSGGWSVGGIERVTVVLANEFVRLERNVVVAFFILIDDSLLKKLDPRVKVIQFPSGFRYGIGVIKAIFSAIKENDIGFVLNAFRLNILFSIICKITGAKQVSCLHSKPDTNGKIVGASSAIVKWFWYRLSGFRRLISYIASDATTVLSERYFAPFERFTGVRHHRKLYAMPNPLTIEPAKAESEKRNQVLYVGRLEENPKRFSRIIKIWSELCEELPTWTLDVLGDGVDRSRYEKMAENLQRITFHGAVDPIPFYQTSKILLLVSDYEGWPSVLGECMANGVIPIVLGSFEAVDDIVSDGRSGIIIKEPFDSTEFVKKILMLANDDVRFVAMSQYARQCARRLLPNEIASKWEIFLKEVLR